MAETDRRSIEVHYIKAAAFRVIHADGGFGGLSPRGYINLSFYSERGAVPTETAIEAVDGKISEKIVASKGGIIRELETCVTLDLNAAVAVFDWLGRHIDFLARKTGTNREALLADLGRAKP